MGEPAEQIGFSAPLASHGFQRRFPGVLDGGDAVVEHAAVDLGALSVEDERGEGVWRLKGSSGVLALSFYSFWPATSMALSFSSILGHALSFPFRRRETENIAINHNTHQHARALPESRVRSIPIVRGAPCRLAGAVDDAACHRFLGRVRSLHYTT
ncbi:hypothetical protein CC80DRAFT_4878 [Byssothecium circinans]|uniref:Uncharacterized protein n=1 Tax=Byssothecium circinans TaxID=147558 RepID=A0A6A5UER9_9PLEO|nr:hypothetical protein CC80DRAFT_4878 [Byssothecium circinans]